MDYHPLRYIFQRASRPSGRTLLLLPGTGGDERNLLPLAAPIGADAHVLSVRGNVLEHGMPRFFRRLAEGVFDEEDVRFRAHELADFLHKVAIQEGFDPLQVVAVGYSNGANIAGALLLLFPDLLAGAALLRPMQPLAEPGQVRPATRAAPVLLSSGRHDSLAPPAATARYAALLAGQGFAVSQQTVAAGHELTQQDVALAAAWYGRHFPTSSLTATAGH